MVVVAGGGTAGLVALLILLGVVMLVLRSGARLRTQDREALLAARADVTSLRSRLGRDVSTLDPGSDPVARQALADASERYAMSDQLLARSQTLPQLLAVRRTVAEGITAARLVRERLGLDPGPAVVLPHAGPELTQRTRVVVDGEQYDASPTYEPGRGHYYEGGYYRGRPVPAGWYAVPFWETALLAGLFGGMLGGGWIGGAGYGSGDWGSDSDGGFGGGGFGGGGWDGGGEGFGGGGFGGGGWDGGGDFGGGGFGGGDFGGGDW